MSPSKPVTVHDSGLQVASTAENVVAPVRASRNIPATEFTSTAPPTLSSAEPATDTCTLEPANFPVATPSVAAAPPAGDVGDPPQAAMTVASVAHDAI